MNLSRDEQAIYDQFMKIFDNLELKIKELENEIEKLKPLKTHYHDGIDVNGINRMVIRYRE